MLLDSQTERGSGISGSDVVMDAGGIDVSVSYAHRSTPQSALSQAIAPGRTLEGEEEEEEEEARERMATVGRGEAARLRLVRIAGGESKLKGLFYALERREREALSAKDDNKSRSRSRGRSKRRRRRRRSTINCNRTTELTSSGTPATFCKHRE